MINHFNTFSFEIDFNINLEELENKYLQFQKQFHPDNVGSTDIENPLRRASHILQLNGIDLENDESAPKPDMETLEEILELQEKVAEINLDEKSDLKKYLNLEVKNLLEKTAKELENNNYNQAAQILIKAKYFDKTLRDLKARK
jgi:DnaJ-domain-containing protein 1